MYRVTILFRVIVAESGCVTMKRVYSKNIPLSVARTEPEPQKIERFGWLTKTNVGSQTLKSLLKLKPCKDFAIKNLFS